ncbi:MAG: hypothetical protein RLZZ338_4699, partial [Cyanobacteriota bacterium]
PPHPPHPPHYPLPSPHYPLPKIMFGKTPLAWLQLTREKTRLLVAVAGISFADILMFVQLGFKDALYDAAVKPHYTLKTDLVLINPQFETLFAVKSFKRERLYQIAGFPGIESVNYLSIGTVQWRHPTNRTTRPILIFGIDPDRSPFKLPEVNENLQNIKLFNRVLFDQASRPEYGITPELFQTVSPLETEVNKRKVQVAGLFTLGASFAADGNVIVSHSTFLNLLGDRNARDIDVGLLQIKQGIDPKEVQNNLQGILPKDVRVLTLEEFAEVEKTYWGNSTPIGFIFGFGTIVGFFVGTVIVYQILYSDVSDHLPEYATLKAMGYSDGYLVVVLFQEALVLALLGCLPGYFVSIGLYHLAKVATMLPLGMTTNRAVTVLVLTIIMCTVSGTIALRKLQDADPADIF